ncbi:MAG: dihydrodipicolinate synthase family protein [Candidatus Bathyarchaeia archaeon]|jgi:4-hydroxy-tetrahydrodipicolinate synthase
MNKTGKLHGVIPIMLTPFNATEEVDVQSLEKHTDFLLTNRVHGVLYGGSSSESPSLSTEERKRGLEIVIDRVKGKVPVIGCASHTSPKVAIDIATHAEKAGAAALLISAPYYFKGGFSRVGEEELLGFFGKIAQSVKIPIILYDNPTATGVTLEASTIARLFKEKYVEYLKISLSDPLKVADVRKLAGDKLTIFCGEEVLAMQFLERGAAGFTVAAPAVLPGHFVDLYEKFMQGRIDEAWDVFYKILPFINVALCEPNYIPCCKEALVMLGVISTSTVRNPLIGIDDIRRAQVRRTLKHLALVN